MKQFVMLFIGLIAGAAVGGGVVWQMGKSGKSGEPAAAAVYGNSAGTLMETTAATGSSARENKTGTSEAAGKASSENANLTGGVRLLAMVKDGPWDESVVEAQLNGMSERELAALIGKVSAMKGKYRWAALHAVYRAWAKIHPEAALAHARKETDASRGSFLGTVLGEWAEKDPRAALGSAINLDNLRQRNSALQTVMGGWAQKDMTGALNYLAQHPELPAMSQLLYRVFSGSRNEGEDVDYAARTALVQRHTSGNTQKNILSNLMSEWATDDPAAALAYVNSMTSLDAREASLENVYNAWAGKDLPAALQSAEGLEDATAREKGVRGIFSEWMSNDPLAAVNYALTKGSAKLLDHVASHSYSLMNSLTAPEMQEILDRLPPGEARNRIVQSATYSATQEGDYPRAVEMVKQMPDAEQRNRSLFDIAKNWAAADPAEVEDWIGQFSASPERDSALGGYVANVAARNPAGAVAWADTIQDEGRQQTARLNIAYQWARRSAAEAERWMTASGFTEADRRKIKEALARTGTTVFTSPTSRSTSN